MLKHFSVLRIEKYVVLILVFLLPTQLAFHFWPSWAFIFGLRVDYLAPAIYLTDVLVLILLVFGFKDIIRYKNYLIWLIVFSIVNIFFSVSPLVTLFKWLKILEFIALAIYFANRPKEGDWKTIYRVLFLSLVLFSLIGIDQFLLGHTIGGVSYWLGERSFTLSTPGIALNSVLGHQVLRAYSTFPHPNALAGYLGVSTIFLYLVGFFNNDRRKIVGLLLVFVCFLLTFSSTAFLALVVVILFRKHISRLFIPTVLVSLLMPIVSERLLSGITFTKNISERLDLTVISGRMIDQNFWFGTGFNTFTIAMTKIKPIITSSWLLQPVHNIFLLTLSETGIFGLLFVFLYCYKLLRRFPIILGFIIITGFFDHYWLDSQQNLLLLSLISGMAMRLGHSSKGMVKYPHNG